GSLSDRLLKLLAQRDALRVPAHARSLRVPRRNVALTGERDPAVITSSMVYKRYPSVIGCPGRSWDESFPPPPGSTAGTAPSGVGPAGPDTAAGLGVNFPTACSARSRRIPSRSAALRPKTSTKD